MKAYYLSLAPFILWRAAERPLNWRARFRESGPLEVEIGFGNGEFLVRRAREHPERRFVGVELEWESVKRALRRIAKAGVGNVRLLQVDARVALERLFVPESVSRVYSLFPLPWPKKRHTRRRLFSRDFLGLAGSRLVRGGEVQIVTDHRPLLDWVLEEARESGFMAQERLTGPRFRTKYERKWREGGQEEFYELILTLRERPAPRGAGPAVPLREDAVLQTHRVKEFDPERFEPRGLRGEVVVEFKDFLYDPKRRVGMVRAVVVEENLTQNLWVQAAQEGGWWRIRPAPGSGAVPTVGVQKALDLVRDAAEASAS